MFNKKVYKKFEEIEEKLWKLENPPRFKRGDKVIFGLSSDYTVLNYNLRKDAKTQNFFWEVEILNSSFTKRLVREGILVIGPETVEDTVKYLPQTGDKVYFIIDNKLYHSPIHKIRIDNKETVIWYYLHSDKVKECIRTHTEVWLNKEDIPSIEVG